MATICYIVLQSLKSVISYSFFNSFCHSVISTKHRWQPMLPFERHNGQWQNNCWKGQLFEPYYSHCRLWLCECGSDLNHQLHCFAEFPQGFYKAGNRFSMCRQYLALQLGCFQATVSCWQSARLLLKLEFLERGNLFIECDTSSLRWGDWET